MGPGLLTIGHSTHPWERFVALLLRHNVTVLADVRSVPYSRMCPQFNRDALKDNLAARGIKYVFLGRELGARPQDRSCYCNGRVQYTLLARTALFRRGIERLGRGASEYRIALMCAEKEPLDCHRTLLVARVLADEGIAVRHILADGRLELHEETMERLLDIVGLPHADLLRSKKELIAEALLRRERQVAYFDNRLAAAADGEGEMP